MSKYRNVPVARPTLIYGKDATEFTDGEIIAQIKACQDAQKALEELHVDSVNIRIQHSQYNQAIDALVAELDRRVPTETTPVNEAE